MWKREGPRADEKESYFEHLLRMGRLMGSHRPPPAMSGCGPLLDAAIPRGYEISIEAQHGRSELLLQ